MLSSQLFRDIIRPCSGCDVPFDVRLHAPHVLPCSHTFCLMCLSKHEQRKKRHCFACNSKYSKFAPNLALMEAIQRLEERRQWIEGELRLCDECSSRVPFKLMRQCQTCEAQFVARTDLNLECVICIECCVNSHNGHHLVPVNMHSSPSPSSAVESPIMPRARLPSTASTVSVHFRSNSHNNHRISAKGLINTIKSWSFRSNPNELSFLLTPSSKLAFSEEDIVMQCKSPFYENGGIKVEQRSKISSPRIMYLDSTVPTPNANDDVSMDSVFGDSPQSTIMNGAKQSPISVRSFAGNDSGIRVNTPPSRYSHSSTCLCNTPTSRYATISNLGTVRQGRRCIRMGVSDIMNSSRHSPLFVPPCIPPNPNLKSTRSEGCVFQRSAENPNYEYL